MQFLIDILNDPRNDFFLLVDAKVKGFDKESFMKSCSTDRLFFVNPIKIYWGDFSQILAELSLLKAATAKENYDYYHLISAVDMPLRSQEEIHAFFEANKGTEFVDFDSYGDSSWANERMQFYYFFQKIIGRRRKDLLKFGRDFIVLLEKLCGINRTKEIKQYLAKGSNWFSITDGLARYIVENEAFVHEHFVRTYCGDEAFVQAMLNMSPYRDNWYGFKNPDIKYQNVRFCDWERGAPYTFSKDEFYELSSRKQYMFARKFDDDIIADEVRNYLEAR